MRAAVLLRHPFRKDIFNVIFPQRCLEFAFSGRVDPLSDNDRFTANLDRLGEGGNDCAVLPDRGGKAFCPACGDHFSDMLRRGAAATAEQVYPHLCDFPHQAGEFIRVNVEYSPAVFAARQACIGVDNNGK